MLVDKTYEYMAYDYVPVLSTMSTLTRCLLIWTETQKLRNSYCLIERFTMSKHLNKSKKNMIFCLKINCFKSSGEDIDKCLKNSPEEIKLLRDIYFHHKWKIDINQWLWIYKIQHSFTMKLIYYSLWTFIHLIIWKKSLFYCDFKINFIILIIFKSLSWNKSTIINWSETIKKGKTMVWSNNYDYNIN